jgi:hypothetical protein
MAESFTQDLWESCGQNKKGSKMKLATIFVFPIRLNSLTIFLHFFY